MIYCVEDDNGIRDLMIYALNAAGLEARGFADGPAFWEGLREAAPELVLLDIMLPGEDGISILKRLRAAGNGVPVIMATAKGAEYDKVIGLDLGADDYLAKPFHIEELCARIRALIRRPAALAAESVLTFRDLSLDLTGKTLACGGRFVTLTPTEFRLFEVFLRHPDTLLSREHLIQKVWETHAEMEPGNLDNYIYFLRKRLRTAASVCVLSSVYGSGYILEAKNDPTTEA